jgi:BirA family biotin operon repressor/biotin-[acetyl-CoA-carboxylase] ligase
MGGSESDVTYESIRPRTKRLGKRLLHLAFSISTMKDARDVAESGEPEGFTLVADQQLAGQGRRGRAWHSPPGNLHATILLRPRVAADRATWVPLLAGAALAESVRRLLDLEAYVKWPNDVLIDGRKVAGVLSEAHWQRNGDLGWILLGVGVNGNIRRASLPEDFRETATSLAEEVQRTVCMPALLKIFLECLEAFLEDLDGPAEGLFDRVRPYMTTLGERVTVQLDSETLEGVATGLGARGELLVDTGDGAPRAVDSGDVVHARSA